MTQVKSRLADCTKATRRYQMSTWKK